MRADTPVPKGVLSFDFLPYHDGRAGIPYSSQFAYAEFSGDYEAMHKTEGYNISAMYDVTRNIMLSQGITTVSYTHLDVYKRQLLPSR